MRGIENSILEEWLMEYEDKGKCRLCKMFSFFVFMKADFVKDDIKVDRRIPCVYDTNNRYTSVYQDFPKHIGRKLKWSAYRTGNGKL